MNLHLEDVVSEGRAASLLIPQDTNDEDVSLFDAEEDAGKTPKKKSIKWVDNLFFKCDHLLPFWVLYKLI